MESEASGIRGLGKQEMNITQIKYILQTAASSSMREAATKLFVSQPTLSSSIRDLEEELGILIFERINKGISLTDAGRELQERAKDVPLNVAGCIRLPPEKAKTLYALLYELLDNRKGEK